MGKFLIRLLLLCVIILAANFLYLFVVDGYLRKYERKYLLLPKNIRVLVLGDSHANRAWAADSGATCYNFAYGSDNITDMLYKFNYASSHNQEHGKRTVVLPFDAHLISAYRELKHNNKANRIINDPPINKYVPYSLPLIFDPNTAIDVKLFFGNIGKEAEADDKVNNRSKLSMRGRMRAQFPNLTESKKLLAEYQHLIDNIRKEGYEINAVRYPVHPYYDSLTRNNQNAIYFTLKMDSLARVNQLSVVDFTKYIREEKYFIDQDHLNKSGSRIFIKLFNDLF
jgi:hypothetical protein